MVVTNTAASGGHFARDRVKLAHFKHVGQSVTDNAEVEDNDVEDEQAGIGLFCEGEADEERDVVDLFDEASPDELGYHWVLIDQQNEVVEEEEG